jgi:hypothetical protein
LLYKNPTPAISPALNAPLVDATSSIDERFLKSPIDKALGSGCGPPAGAELAVAVSVGAFAVAVAFVGFFKVFFFVAIFNFLLIPISI